MFFFENLTDQQDFVSRHFLKIYARTRDIPRLRTTKDNVASVVFSKHCGRKNDGWRLEHRKFMIQKRNF